jgi:PKD repeat protein
LGTFRTYPENRSITAWLAAGAILLALALQQPSLLAQASIRGLWRTLPYLMPINPVHLALTHDGNVLVIAGSGNHSTETTFRAVVWDPVGGTFVPHTLGWDMFCNGMSMLADGRVFINGGNLRYNPFLGEPRSAVYDPVSGTFTDLENMADGRWYPTVTTLGDGSVMTFSGLKATAGTNTTVEIYTPGTGWSQPSVAGWTPPLYPRMHLSTDGRVFYSGSSRSTRFFSPATMTWSATVYTTKYSGTRRYGSSVLLPLTPANGYQPRVMIFGGGSPSTATTEIIDLSAAPPRWQFGPSMSQPRIQMNATILPNGKVLVVGGSYYDEDAGTASLNADLYDPGTNTFSSAGANAYPRLYHSGSLLLPDATVLLVGGNPTEGSYEPHIEIYSPSYLFNGDDTPATRPTISDVTPGASGYGQVFQVRTPDPSSIASVVLVRPGAQTHAFDMEQRLVGLSFAPGEGVLNVTAPPNGNVAPPGYYMLFVVNAAGVPSVASFVQLSTATSNQRPTATIASPATNVTVNPGASVSFAGIGTDPDGTIEAYSWTFSGGVPASSSVPAPGNVVYSTPGTYTASFTVTDNGGLPDQSPATRTITVADFSVTASPGSRTIARGNSTTYSATVSPLNGFTGAVGFSVSGLPAGATAGFSPASVTTSGSTTLTVSTTTATPAGSYPLTITGTSGTRSRSVNVTLTVVIGNQAPTATIGEPATNLTINPGGSVAFSGTGSDPDGTISAYAWTFAGGVPASSSVAAPGSIVYSMPGTYTASFKVTDNGGLKSPIVTRTIKVADFSLSSPTPGSRTVVAGASTTYSTAVSPYNGFTGTVGFSVSGVPSGATAAFSPGSVTTSGPTTLMVSTTAATPAGSYPLTITATSGGRTRTVNVTLVVHTTFAVAVSPASRTIAPTGTATYTVTVTAGVEFSGPVTLSVTGLPSQYATSKINPSVITTAGTSTLRIDTTSAVARGAYILTVNGTAGSLVRSATVTLIIQ